MKTLLLLITVNFIFVACSSGEKDNGVYTKSVLVDDKLSKSVKAPWKKVRSEGSDIALLNTKSNSFFIFNSACRKFDPSNLPTLTNSILTGINEIEFLDKTMTTHQERDAVLVIAKGSVDGVERFFRILTTQKNNCIYDLALISTSKAQLDKDSADYNHFIQLLKFN